MIYYLLGGALILGLIMKSKPVQNIVDPSQPRGIRNNNPLNIKHSNSEWLGKSDEQTDKTFVQFENPIFGIRAAAKIINNYSALYGITTIRGVINRWAPHVENATDNYIDIVANRTGLTPDTIITPENLPQILSAMIYVENGVNPYSYSQISAGVNNAIV